MEHFTHIMCWTNITFLFFSAMILGVYSDQQAIGPACPDRNRCTGYQSDQPFLYRSCECDSNCTAYHDCCIDAVESAYSQGASQGYFECLQYGYNIFKGVYAVSRCDSNWNGPTEIKQKCERASNFSDPAGAAPVTSLTQRITYKNVHCAECNNADKKSLDSFQYEYACRESTVNRFPNGDITQRLTYNQAKNKWGVYVRGYKDGQPTFEECAVIFDVPEYINSIVRFCRANIVFDCSNDWLARDVRQLCHSYTSVVYDSHGGYKNPHCAICNHAVTSELSCSVDRVDTKKKLVPFTSLKTKPSSYVAFNPFFSLLPRNRCSEGHVYDIHAKKCRKLSCALPGYVIRNRKCVKGD